MTVEQPEQDVLALIGLRRLVEHARDQLVATKVEPKWTYDHQAWSPAQIKRYVATGLAEHVLTLVLDCIPAGDGVTADEARALREAAETSRAKAAQLESRLDVVTKEARSAVDNAVAWEEDAVAVRAVFEERAERLGVGLDEDLEADAIAQALDSALDELDRLRAAEAERRNNVGGKP